MTMKLIADSCCDMTQQLRKKLELISVPLTMWVDDTEFTDDQDLDIESFMQAMRESPNPAASAAPTPYAYLDAFRHDGPSFAITISSNLSGSYSSAMLAKSMADEEGYSDIHVFDSKSASAGEVLVAIKTRELLDQGANRETIIESIEAFIDKMKTFFVLENYSNLEKNGRLNKISGKIISVLNIKLVMGSDGNGNIALYEKARGKVQMIKKLLGQIENSGKKTNGEQMVISHCNNPSLAAELAERIREKFRFGNVLIIPAGGLTSLYADDKGIVMAF